MPRERQSMQLPEHDTHVASLWNRLTSSWADPDARVLLSKATPVSLPIRSPRLKLLLETQSFLETLLTHLETAAEARVKKVYFNWFPGRGLLLLSLLVKKHV